jgi:hypothetical protein
VLIVKEFLIKYHLVSGTILSQTVMASSLNGAKVVALPREPITFEDETKYVIIDPKHVAAVEVEEVFEFTADML